MINIKTISESINIYSGYFANTLLLAKSELPLRNALHSHLLSHDDRSAGAGWLSEKKYSGKGVKCDLAKENSVAIEIKLCYSFEFTDKIIDKQIIYFAINDLKKLINNDVFNQNEEKFFILFAIHLNPAQLVGEESHLFKQIGYITGESNIPHIGKSYLSLNDLCINGTKYSQNQVQQLLTIRGKNLFDIDIKNICSIVNGKIIDKFQHIECSTQPKKTLNYIDYSSIPMFTIINQKRIDYSLIFFLYELQLCG